MRTTPSERFSLILLIAAVFCSLLTACSSDGVRDRGAGSSLASGYAALEQSQHDQAITMANRQLQQSPRGHAAAEAHYLKGRAYEQRTAGSTQEAASNLQAARTAYIQALQQQPTPRLEGLIRAGVANVAYWQDDYATAVQQWQVAYPLLEQPAAKSFTLYRIGLSMQRLGRFDEADRHFTQVQQLYPGTDAALRARAHQGHRSFSVQVATFASPQNAQTAVTSLRSMGMTPAQTTNGNGHHVVSIGPIASYAQAKGLQARVVPHFPDALIVP
jgi:tetratricopeptide (TPR) repeat protein